MNSRPSVRIALITPFFGRETNRGDERFVFELASQLAVRHVSLTVMTSCGRSADDDWGANYYRAGRDMSEPFPIERFKLVPRDNPAFERAVLALSVSGPGSPSQEDDFLREGVRSPDLLSHLRRVTDAFDAFLFVSYGATTTLLGVPVVAERAIVFPCLDDDPLRLSRVVRDRLTPARAFLVKDQREHDELISMLGNNVALKCFVVGPAEQTTRGWDEAANAIVRVVEGLAAIDDGRTRAEVLAQVAYLYPLVRKQRSLLIAMQQSRFWKLRNVWFKLKRQLKILGEDALPHMPPESEAAEFKLVSDAYFLWRERNSLRPEDVTRLRTISQLLPMRPVVDVVMDVGNVSQSELTASLASLSAQIWLHWSARVILPPGASGALRDVVRRASERDVRIRLYANDVQAALAECTGDFAGPLEGGDQLEADAFFELALSVNTKPELAVVYADEDEIDEKGSLRSPRFKPDWAPDTALSRDFVGRPIWFRPSLVREIGGYRPAFGRAAWYDLLLRASERILGKTIGHIPRVLYHRRAANAALPRDNVAHAIRDALERRGDEATVVALPNAGPEHFAVRYALRRPVSVSVIIPTRDRAQLLDACLESVFARSGSVDYEVVVVDNGSRQASTASVLAAWSHRQKRFRTIRADIPFNFSKLNNLAARAVESDFIVLLNNDTVVLTDDWLQALVEQAQRPTTGAVGAMLLYADDTVQHAGVVMGVLGLAGHAHRFAPGDAPGYFGALQAPTNYAAVTGACMAVERKKFLAIGGLDETLAMSYNDVDFCLRLHAAGYQNLYLPYVRLYHFESKTRGHDDTPAKVRRAMEEMARIRERWPEISERDPYYNPNLTSDAENFALKL